MSSALHAAAEQLVITALENDGLGPNIFDVPVLGGWVSCTYVLKGKLDATNNIVEITDDRGNTQAFVLTLRALDTPST